MCGASRLAQFSVAARRDSKVTERLGEVRSWPNQRNSIDFASDKIMMIPPNLDHLSANRGQNRATRSQMLAHRRRDIVPCFADYHTH
jgi:hypothetical protein